MTEETEVIKSGPGSRSSIDLFKIGKKASLLLSTLTYRNCNFSLKARTLSTKLSLCDRVLAWIHSTYSALSPYHTSNREAKPILYFEIFGQAQNVFPVKKFRVLPSILQHAIKLCRGIATWFWTETIALGEKLHIMNTILQTGMNLNHKL